MGLRSKMATGMTGFNRIDRGNRLANEESAYLTGDLSYATFMPIYGHHLSRHIAKNAFEYNYNI